MAGIVARLPMPPPQQDQNQGPSTRTDERLAEIVEMLTVERLLKLCD